MHAKPKICIAHTRCNHSANPIPNHTAPTSPSGEHSPNTRGLASEHTAAIA